MPQTEYARFINETMLRARDGFQHLFLEYGVSEAIASGEDNGHPLHGFLDFVNSPVVLDAVRQITGLTAISRADCIASRYEPGHFLSSHDDRHERHKRLAAYTLSLSPTWRADWGGQLLFLDERGDVTAGLTPQFNRFAIFAVPQAHAVGYVTPFAAAPRLSLTGWFHAAANA